ncbi:MAG: IclR family transcriptional regulator [Dehalococcoidales bacterium]|nr:IclR family transcriptional regulator [Dehalococcoidales bacterium]
MIRKLPTEQVLHIKRSSPARKKAKERTTLKAVYRTAEILRLLQRGPASLSVIADELGIHRSTALRLLRALEDAGLAVRNRLNRQYYIGSLITELVSDPDVTHQYLVSCALNPMKRLAAYTRESIGLNVLIGTHNILLYEIPSTYELQVVAKKKVSSELHAGAASKVLLAQLSPKDLDIVINNLDFKPITERTITSKEELLAQLKRIREQGYAIGYGERIPEAMSIAVPIQNYIIPVALGILGPENRMKPKTDEFLKAIQEARAEIEKNIAESL